MMAKLKWDEHIKCDPALRYSARLGRSKTSPASYERGRGIYSQISNAGRSQVQLNWETGLCTGPAPYPR